MRNGNLLLLAILFAVIILGSTALLGAFSGSTDIYDRDSVLEAVTAHYGGEVGASWTDDLDRVIPPDERERLMEADPSDLSMTDQFARELLSLSLYKHTENEDITDISEYLFLFEALMQESGLVLPDEGRYSADTLNVLTSYTKEDIRSYGTRMGTILLENSPDLDHELIIFGRAMGANNEQARRELQTLAAGYRAIAKEGGRVPVPQSAANIHAYFLNSMEQAGLFVEGMSHATSDPLKALLSAEGYTGNSQHGKAALESIGAYFRNTGVSFRESEPGFAYAFMGFVDMDAEIQRIVEENR